MLNMHEHLYVCMSEHVHVLPSEIGRSLACVVCECVCECVCVHV